MPAWHRILGLDYGFLFQHFRDSHGNWQSLLFMYFIQFDTSVGGQSLSSSRVRSSIRSKQASFLTEAIRPYINTTCSDIYPETPGSLHTRRACILPNLDVGQTKPRYALMIQARSRPFLLKNSRYRPTLAISQLRPTSRIPIT